MTHTLNTIELAKFQIGQVVRHRLFPFRGVIFDVDPVFSNSEEWLAAIPAEFRPARNQPFYHVFAENDEASFYEAYVSQQNLLPDDTGPVSHPDVAHIFGDLREGVYALRQDNRH